LALKIFEITKMTWASAQRSSPAAVCELTEGEFLALDVLQQSDGLTVGDLQRRIRVLPAQMSRVIKTLETKYEKPLVDCTINPEDKRKINVRLTTPGRQAADSFRRSKLAGTVEAMRMLPPQDVRELMRIAGTMHQAMLAAPPTGRPSIR
jgi:DNA-binding MarR family transcriptional regulator